MMAKYRDDLDAARLRMETLEAKLAERDAELSERDAALTARDAEIAELKAAQKRPSSSFLEQPEEQAKPQQSNAKWLLLAVLVIAAAAGAIRFLQTRASERAEQAERQAAEEKERQQRERQRRAEERAVLMKEKQAMLRAKADEAERRSIEREMAAARSAGESGDMGRVNVNCMPPSEVIVDGKRVGRTPLRDYSLPAGRHAVQCSGPDQQRASKSVLVEADKTTTVVLKL